MVRDFYGAFAADQTALKGVFVTTSIFTDQAKDFARSVGLELIDGAQLTALLENHGFLPDSATAF
jgi:restriction system protein